jgi:hypothetical protein
MYSRHRDLKHSREALLALRLRHADPAFQQYVNPTGQQAPSDQENVSREESA